MGSFEIEDGVLKKYTGDDEDVVIPSGVVEIAPQAFAYRVNMKSITIPQSVELIGDRAFYMCMSLKAVTLPEGIDQICDLCFMNCVELKTIEMPKGVTRIGFEAFADCFKLERLTVPAAVLTIEEFAFKECNKLSRLDFLSERSFEAFRTNLWASRSVFEDSLAGKKSLWNYLPNLEKVTVEGTDAKHYRQFLRPTLKGRLKYILCHPRRKKKEQPEDINDDDSEGSFDFYGPV